MADLGIKDVSELTCYEGKSEFGLVGQISLAIMS
jgi:hypothetical protein